MAQQDPMLGIIALKTSILYLFDLSSYRRNLQWLYLVTRLFFTHIKWLHGSSITGWGMEIFPGKKLRSNFMYGFVMISRNKFALNWCSNELMKLKLEEKRSYNFWKARWRLFPRLRFRSLSQLAMLVQWRGKAWTRNKQSRVLPRFQI